MLWIWFSIINYFGRKLKTSLWVEKNILQFEMAFSTSKYNWNIIETIVENLNFSPSVKIQVAFNIYFSFLAFGFKYVSSKFLQKGNKFFLMTY